MALVKETGSGVDDANTYATRAEFDAYITERALSTSATSAQKDAALLYACELLESRYAWIGERQTYRTDRLSWPRNNAEDCEGRDFSGTQMPAVLATAQMEFAFAHLTDGLNDPLGAGVSSESVGPVSVSYTSAGPVELERAFPFVDRMLRHLYKYRHGSGGATKMVRR